MELRIFSQEPSARQLSEHLRRHYPSANYQVVYEAGFCGFGYQREFSALGINCMIVHPADVPTTDKDKQRKSDTVDCRKLSKTLGEGGAQWHLCSDSRPTGCPGYHPRIPADDQRPDPLQEPDQGLA